MPANPAEIVPLLVSVPIVLKFTMPAKPPEIKAPLLTVKLHSSALFDCSGAGFALMTVLPLHPLAQAALFAKKKLTPNVTANVSALSMDTRGAL